MNASTATSKLRQGRLTFSHSLHVKDSGIECAQCHATVSASTSGLDRLIPGHSECASCHDVEDQTACATCHSDPAKIVSAPPAGAGYEAFSHQLHTAKMACDKCHPVQAGTAYPPTLYPDMAGCAECHTASNVDMSCARCHTSGMPASPASHKVGWDKRHGEESRWEMAQCAMCHQATGAKSTCAQCHQGAEFSSPHPRNFVHSTAFIRGGGLASCQSCHEAESFCAACHQQKMVLPSDHSRSGWATPAPSAGGLHARKGEMDVTNCLICHANLTRQPTCFSAGCHQ